MNAIWFGIASRDRSELLANFRRRAALMALVAVGVAGGVAVLIAQWQIENDAARRAADAVARLSRSLVGADRDTANWADVLQNEHLVGYMLTDSASGLVIVNSLDNMPGDENLDSARVVQRTVSDVSGKQLSLTGYYHVPSAFARLTSLNSLWAMGSTTLGALLASLLGYWAFRRSIAQITTLGDQLLESNLTLLRTLGSAAAHRDCDTDSHNYRVSLNALRLGRLLDFSEEDLRALTIGAFLHDIGKLAVPDSVLRKPGPLTSLEREVMKKHVEVGAQIVAAATWLADARSVILHHHEHFDGGGYPFGLKGDEIPLIARAFAVIDVFDALTSTRSYKQAFSVDDACNAIQEGSGTHFDPYVCEVFLKHVQQFEIERADANIEQLRSRLDLAIGGLFKVSKRMAATSPSRSDAVSH